MKNKILKLIIFGTILLLRVNLFSQNSVTIDYTKLSTSDCNIFATSTNVNGLAHLTNIGQVTYDALNKAINLDATVTLDLNGLTSGYHRNSISNKLFF